MHSHDDELLVLAEALGEVKTKTEKLEAEFSTQARPLEAATNALSATLSGIKALQFHVIDNNLGALSARVEEMRKAVDEQVGVIALELKKADESNAAKAGQEADALRSEIAGLQAQLGTLGAQFEAQLARVEFAAKEEAKKLQLIPGPAGEAGASLNPRGTFIDGQTYNRLDVVSWLGSSYIATVDGVTEKPSKTSTQWQVLASRGNGGGGTASLNDMLGAPSAGTIVGSEGSSYVRKTLVAGANIAISETPSTITITGSEGQISLEDGSAAAPSLFFTNDPDTGIYRPGSNQVGISLGGSEQAVLTSTTFTVTPNLVVSGTGTSSIGGNATVAGTLTVNGAGTSSFQSTTPSTVQIANTTSGLSASQFAANGVVLGTLKFGHPSDGEAAKFPSIVGQFNATDASFARKTWLNFYTSDASGNNLVASLTDNKNLLIGGTTDISGTSGLKVFGTTASTSTSTGALVVSGGVGVAGAINAGGALTVNGKIRNDPNTSISGDVAGGISNLSATGYGLRVQGGASGSGYILSANDYTGSEKFQIAGSGNATFAGTLTVSGTGTSAFSGPITASTSATNTYLFDAINTNAAGYSLIRFENTGASGRSFDVGLGGATSGQAGLFYIYDNLSFATRLSISSAGTISLPTTTASTSTSTGALVVSGGVGVAGAANIGGTLTLGAITTPRGKLDSQQTYNGSAPSTSATPIIRANNGGAISLWTCGQGYDAMWLQAIQDDGANLSKSLLINPLGSNVELGSTSSQVLVKGTTASTSTSTGALVVSGGVGVAGAAYVGGNLVIGSTSQITNTASVASGTRLTLNTEAQQGIDIFRSDANANFSGIRFRNSANSATNAQIGWNGTTLRVDAATVEIPGTTASTSTSTGALVVSGGVGVAGAAYIGGKVSINGASVSASQFAIASASGTLIANLTAGSTTDQSFGLRIFAGTTASDYGLLIRNVGDTAQLFKVDGVGGTTVGGSVTTAAPAGGTAAAWKLGTVATVSPTSPNRTIEVDIGGTIYYIHAKTTNN